MGSVDDARARCAVRQGAPAHERASRRAARPPARTLLSAAPVAGSARTGALGPARSGCGREGETAARAVSRAGSPALRGGLAVHLRDPEGGNTHAPGVRVAAAHRPADARPAGPGARPAPSRGPAQNATR